MRLKRAAQLDAALNADYDAMRHTGWTHCANCGRYGCWRGPHWTLLRCFPCHTESRAVQARAQRRVKR